MTTAALWLVWMSASFALSWLAVYAMRRNAARLGLVDHPNHRSLHDAPVPRGGGAGFLAVFVLLIGPAAQALGIELSAAGWRALIAAVFVGAVGLADDRFGLPALARLAAQCGAAGFVAAPWLAARLAAPGNGGQALDAATCFAAMFGIVAVTNFFNFMDGADGLAAGQAVLTLASAVLIALHGGGREVALLCGLLGASVGGFLVHNWHPAGIFMGDAGSTFLGFLFGSLATSAVFEPGYAAVPPAAWLCLLSPFLADATTTLARRIGRGEHWYRAHREHFYQQLIQAGWGHGRVTAAYLSVTGVLAVVTVAHFSHGVGTLSLLVGTCLAWILAAYWAVRRADSRGGPIGDRVSSHAPAALKHSLR